MASSQLADLEHDSLADPGSVHPGKVPPVPPDEHLLPDQELRRRMREKAGGRGSQFNQDDPAKPTATMQQRTDTTAPVEEQPWCHIDNEAIWTGA